MFEEKITEPAMLCLPESVVDGVCVFRELPVKIRWFEAVSTNPREPGLIYEQFSFLMLSPEEPTPGSRIRRGEAEYEITAIRPLRDPLTQTLIYRCS